MHELHRGDRNDAAGEGHKVAFATEARMSLMLVLNN